MAALRSAQARGARAHTAEIASAGQFNSDSPSSLVEPLMGLKLDKLQVQASTQVLKASFLYFGGERDQDENPSSTDRQIADRDAEA